MTLEIRQLIIEARVTGTKGEELKWPTQRQQQSAPLVDRFGTAVNPEDWLEELEKRIIQRLRQQGYSPGS